MTMELQEHAMGVAASTTEVAGHEDSSVVIAGSYKLGKSASGANSFTNDRYFSAPLSPYFSPRIQSMGLHRRQFTNGIEFQIESSKIHWSSSSPEATCCGTKKPPKWGLIGREIGKLRLGHKLTEDSEILYAKSLEKSREVLKRLTRVQHPFFRNIKDLVLGEKIAEGGQADIFEGTCTAYTSFYFEGTSIAYTPFDKKPSECVVKVFKKGLNFQLLQSQWPSNVCRKIIKSYNSTGTSEILGGTILKDGRCAFVLQRYWGDLRTLIDHKKLDTGNRCPPFQESVAMRILWQIARGIVTLHDNNILHRDLKASNVLLNMYSHGFSPDYPDCYVADFEYSVGIVGTGFWRAPEILLALKNGSTIAAAAQCTKMADVYSFGMTCYEVLTGRIPFEDMSTTSYDVVLGGQRPELPAVYNCHGMSTRIGEMVRACWDADASKRPSFKEICEVIETEVNRRRWHLESEQGNQFPYYGWRGKEKDVSMVQWRWYHPGSFGNYGGFYFVPYTVRKSSRM